MASTPPRLRKSEVHGSPHGTHDPLLRGKGQLAGRSNKTASETGPSDAKNSTSKLRRNRHKHRSNGDNTDDTTVNAGFSGSKSGQRKKPYKRNNEGPSSLDRILDRPCQIHGTPDKQANHTNRDCWVFKQAGKLNAENKEKGSQSEDEDESAGSRTPGDRKIPPPKSKR